MSVIRAFFGTIGTFFGSVFGAVLLFIVLLVGSIFLFVYLENKDDYKYYDDRPPRVIRRTPEESEEPASDEETADEETIGEETTDEETTDEAAIGEDMAATGPYPQYMYPTFGAKSYKPFFDIDISQNQSISEPPEKDSAEGEPQDGDAARQETGDDDADGGSLPTLPGIDGSGGGSLPDVPGNVMLNSAEIGGDPALMQLNIEADIAYRSDLDAINEHLANTGEIPESVLESLRETLEMYEATTRAAYRSNLLDDKQAVYARIKAVQIRRFLGLPV